MDYMTQDEFVRFIANKIGLEIEKADTRPNGRDYWVVSPTGIKLFQIGVYKSDGAWRIGGLGAFNKELWEIEHAV